MGQPITHEDTTRFQPRRWLVATAAAVLVLSLPLLAFRATPRGSIAGRVTSQDKPVVIGTVVLLAADKTMHSCPLDAQGRYVFDQVVAGSAKLGVISRDPAKVTQRQSKFASAGDRLKYEDRGAIAVGNPKQWFAVPVRYEDPRASGLEVVIAGAIELELKLD